MSYCSKCGAELPEGALFCQTCGAPTQAGLPPERSSPAPESPEKKKRKSVFRRWWFWVLVLAILAAPLRSGFAPSVRTASPQRTAVTAAPAVRATAAPSPARAPATAAPAETEIRPEVKEFLDSYESFMDEYVEFMKKYMSAGTDSMMSMMGDYYSILSRYADFSAKIDAMDESQLTNAELSYYIEVTGRVSQKLLAVAG